MAQVFIPSLMRRLTNGQEQVTIPGATLRQVINNLEEAYPGMKEELVDENGIRAGIAVAINGETSHLGLLERVDEHAEIHFIPAIGGGNLSRSL